jgi:hypothetical protein
MASTKYVHKDSQLKLTDALEEEADEIKEMQIFNDNNSQVSLDDIGIEKRERDNKKNCLANSSGKKELTVFTKICFGLAGMCYQMYFCAIGVFATVFLLNSAGLPPKKNTFILFISRSMDAISDLVYGYFVEKSKETRFGKMRPW